MSDPQLSYRIGNNLYLNITDRCTLVCTFCPKTLGVRKVHDYDLTLEQRPETERIIQAVGDPSQYGQIVFCGFGEPTLRLKVILEVARWIKENGGSVRINTDGLANLVHKRNVLPELAPWVDSLSVSLNAQNEAVYNRHCAPQLPGSYAAVRAFLAEAPQWIPDVTATAIDGLDGVDIDACERIAQDLGVKFRKRSLDMVG